MAETTKPKRIGVLGPFGFGNLGDAAIQRAMIQHLQKHFPDAEIYGYSMNPADTEERHGIKTFPVTRRPEKEFTQSEVLWRKKKLFWRIAGWFQYNPNPIIRKIERVVVRVPAEIILAFQAYKNLQGLDMLIFSGGGQLDDLWGGPWKHPYVMFKFSLLARLRGIKTAFVSVGVESVHTFFGRFFVKTALSQASYISFRDRWSREFIEQNQLNGRQEHLTYPDLAHSLDIDSLQKTRSTPEPAPSGAPIVGINPVPFCDPHYWPIKDKRIYHIYQDKLVSLLVWLLERNYRIKFIRSDIYPDKTAALEIMEIINQRGVQYDPAQIIEPNIDSLDRLVEELTGIDYLIASRLHSILLAQRVTIPVIALSYQMKIDKLMEDTGQGEYCFPIDTFDPEEVKRRFLQLEVSCAQVKSQISRRSLEYRAALDEQYERLFKII